MVAWTFLQYRNRVSRGGIQSEHSKNINTQSNTLGVGSIMLPIKIPLLQSSKPVNMLSYIAKEMVHM